MIKDNNYNIKLFWECSSEYLEYTERKLKIKYTKEKDIYIRQEILFFLLLCLLKKNKIEDIDMLKYYKDFIILTQKLEKSVNKNLWASNSKFNKLMFDVFYKTNIYRLFFLESHYKSINLSSKADWIKVLRKWLERREYYVRKEYIKYFNNLFDNVLTKHWTSFWNLATVWLLIILWFWFWFYLIDFFSEEKHIWFWVLETIDFYLYLSIWTFSNLWVDANTPTLFIRSLFALIQTLWLIIFWVLVILISKKLD